MFSSDAELLRELAKTQPPPQSPREKRIGLITAMGHFRPKNATPIQFYNYVREFCIMHNCSIDEAMERAPETWTHLSKDQRKLYNSAMHAALPIPVPRHLIYRAIQMERAGRWKLSTATAANGSSTTYSVESYTPPVKPTKQQERLRAQLPRYDNLADPPYGPDSPRSLCRSGNSTSTSAPNSPKAAPNSTRAAPEQKAQRTLVQPPMTPPMQPFSRIMHQQLQLQQQELRQQQQQYQRELRKNKKKEEKQQQQDKSTPKSKSSSKWKSKKLMSIAAVRKNPLEKPKTKAPAAALTTPKTEAKRKSSRSKKSKA